MPLDYLAFQHSKNTVLPVQYHVFHLCKLHLNSIVLEHIPLDYLAFQHLNNSVPPFLYCFYHIDRYSLSKIVP